jgi:N-acetylmuramoyl-L-alanine amidase
MRRAAIYRIQRLFAIIGFIAFVGIILVVARIANVGFSWEQFPITRNMALPLLVPAPKEQIALISGHAGYDSGATCADSEGNTTLTEADVNTDIANRAAKLLRSAGMDVAILEEYDPRINNLQVDALLSLHADSCIDASGYKAAYYLYSTIPAEDARLVDCIDLYYPAATGLTQHANTITHNMTEYHAFRKVGPTTPAAILELGFLGGDQELLTTEADRAARGVADSIRCFVNLPDPTPEPLPTATVTS